MIEYCDDTFEENEEKSIPDKDMSDLVEESRGIKKVMDELYPNSAPHDLYEILNGLRG